MPPRKQDRKEGHCKGETSGAKSKWEKPFHSLALLLMEVVRVLMAANNDITIKKPILGECEGSFTCGGSLGLKFGG